MAQEIRAFAPDDYDAARQLWDSIEGVGISDSDSRAGIELFLQRNPGLSFVAIEGRRVVGTILAGHDGRRGYIHHLAVHPQYRNRGLGRGLMSAGLVRLKALGIQKCHLLVFRENKSGQEFWGAVGAQARPELALYSIAV